MEKDGDKMKEEGMNFSRVSVENGLYGANIGVPRNHENIAILRIFDPIEFMRNDFRAMTPEMQEKDINGLVVDVSPLDSSYRIFWADFLGRLLTKAKIQDMYIGVKPSDCPDERYGDYFTKKTYDEYEEAVQNLEL